MKEINYYRLSQKAIAEEVKALDNDSLYWNFVNLLPGDDYDGCFSKKGRVALDFLEEELLERLHNSGFLSTKDVPL